MKKVIALLLALSLIFIFAACGGKNDSSSTNKDAVSKPITDTNTSQEDAFVKPEHYDTVLLITINPQFRLYVDENEEVVAVEPVNDDAKSVVKDTKVTGELKDVINQLVEDSNDCGFVKENAKVEFKLVESKSNELNEDQYFNNVKKIASEAFDEIKVEVQIETAVEEGVLMDDEEDLEDSSQPAHTHKFSKATCTEPKTCECGETEGKALGHSYKDGKCTVCKTADPNYKPTSLVKKKGVWSTEFVNNKYYYSVSFNADTLEFGVGIGDPLSEMEKEIQDDIRKHKNEEGYKESYVVFNGKEYWSARGSGSKLKPISENGNTITLTALEEAEAQIVLTRTDENTLTVKSLTQTFKDMIRDIPVGTKLVYKAK